MSKYIVNAKHKIGKKVYILDRDTFDQKKPKILVGNVIQIEAVLEAVESKEPIVQYCVSKRKRAKDGVQNTQRYSFEITAELKQQLERAVLEHQLATGKKVSTSKVIRTAIEKYLKTGKL